MKTRIIVSTAVVAAGFVLFAAGSAGRGAAPSPYPDLSGGPAPTGYADTDALPIEVCFVMDTTGSMQRLLQGAKDKVWSIANEILKDNPKCPLRLAMVAYRDRDRPAGTNGRGGAAEEYVTKMVDMTDDLDGFYKELIAFQAKGGGDGPESVNQALQEAVEKVSWSKEKAVKLIFLVGDAPPHMDYPDDVKYPETIKKAREMRIVVNAIQCGSMSAATPIFEEIARSGGGIYFPIEQSGNVIAIRTPQDQTLLDLNKKLAETVVPYGNRAQQASVVEKSNSFKDMPLEAAASRVAVNILQGGKAVQGKGDLVQDVQADKNLLANLKAEDLPENLQKMTPEERQKYLDEKLAQRKVLNEQIASVTKQRDEVVRVEMDRQLAARGAAGAAGAGGFGGRGGGAGGGGGGRGGSFDGAVRAGTAAGRAAAGR